MKTKFIILWLLILVSILYFTRSESYQHKQVNEHFLYNTSSNFIQTWKPILDTFPISEKNIAQSILKNEMGILPMDNSLQKVEKISAFLLKLFQKRKRDPEKFAFKLTPIALYQAIVENKTGAYCTQHSTLFTFFARCSGLVTRQIGSYGKYDQHVANETYLPELKQWIYTDLTANMIYATHENKIINLATLFTLLKNQQPNIIQSLTFKNSLYIEHIPTQTHGLQHFYDSTCKFYFFYELNLNKQFMPIEKLKRYFLNKPFFIEYNTSKRILWMVYLKYLLFTGILFLFFLLIKQSR